MENCTNCLLTGLRKKQQYTTRGTIGESSNNDLLCTVGKHPGYLSRGGMMDEYERVMRESPASTYEETLRLDHQLRMRGLERTLRSSKDERVRESIISRIDREKQRCVDAINQERGFLHREEEYQARKPKWKSEDISERKLMRWIGYLLLAFVEAIAVISASKYQDALVFWSITVAVLVLAGFITALAKTPSLRIAEKEDTREGWL